jgi:hypothetical protein
MSPQSERLWQAMCPPSHPDNRFCGRPILIPKQSIAGIEKSPRGPLKALVDRRRRTRNLVAQGRMWSRSVCTVHVARVRLNRRPPSPTDGLRASSSGRLTFQPTDRSRLVDQVPNGQQRAAMRALAAWVRAAAAQVLEVCRRLFRVVCLSALQRGAQRSPGSLEVSRRVGGFRSGNSEFVSCTERPVRLAQGGPADGDDVGFS